MGQTGRTILSLAPSGFRETFQKNFLDSSTMGSAILSLTKKTHAKKERRP